MIKKTLIAATALSLVGCSAPPTQRQTYDMIRQEMQKAAASNPRPAAAVPQAVSEALLPPMQPLKPPAQKAEERFSVAFNEVNARQFFAAIGAHSRFNVLVHPDVNGNISANLKNVTLFEALDSIREIYGYDYTVEGNRVVIKPLTLQTRVFQVNYLNAIRMGSSDTRVAASSGGATQPNTGTTGAGAIPASNVNPTAAPGTSNTGTPGALGNQIAPSSRVSSTANNDFWSELRDSIKAIVNIDERDRSTGKDGRSVVVSRQSGVIVVRAMPDELRSVAQYLKASQLAIERQVILEAKILEVQLNDSFQQGVNWASFASVLGNPLGLGFAAPGTTLMNRNFVPTPTSTGQAVANGLYTAADTINPITGLRGSTTYNTSPGSIVQAAGNAAGSIFGVAIQSSNFAALLTFLETQGNVHVLSSPRIATLNNQKAILKVGTDDFFVTKVSSTVNTAANGNTATTPDVTLQQFFSGVVLDVTPQIDDQENIILHVHPSVTEVTTLNRQLNLGQLGQLVLPLASSNTSETDSVVRGQNGQIIAIGGLMRQASSGDQSQVPGAGDAPVIGGLFRNNTRVNQKRELVILIKPTIVDSGAAWGGSLADSQNRIQQMEPPMPGARN
jgi:MSHA biogenesis protein MshL